MHLRLPFWFALAPILAIASPARGLLELVPNALDKKIVFPAYLYLGLACSLWGTTAGATISSGSQNFSRSNFDTMSNIVQDVNLYVGSDPDGFLIPQPHVVPNALLGEAPYNSILAMATFDFHRKFNHSCTMFSVGDPHILLVSSHCQYLSNKSDQLSTGRNHKPIRAPLAYALQGGKSDGSASQDRELAKPCVNGTNNPDQDLNNDYAVYYIKKPFAGVKPLSIVSPAQLPNDCQDHLTTLEYLPSVNPSHRIYEIKNCRREISSETEFNANYRHFGLKKNPHAMMTDCGTDNGSSGAPIFCQNGSSYDLYGLASDYAYPHTDESGLALHNTKFQVDTGNFAVPLNNLITGINKCLAKHNLPPIAAPTHSKAGSVASFVFSSN